jgi:hypothetical protein
MAYCLANCIESIGYLKRLLLTLVQCYWEDKTRSYLRWFGVHIASHMATLDLCTYIIFVFQLLAEFYYCNQFQGLRWAVNVARIVEKRPLRRLGSKIDL